MFLNIERIVVNSTRLTRLRKCHMNSHRLPNEYKVQIIEVSGGPLAEVIVYINLGTKVIPFTLAVIIIMIEL